MSIINQSIWYLVSMEMGDKIPNTPALFYRYHINVPLSCSISN